MRNFLLRLIINAAALAATAAILPGIHIQNDRIGTLLLVALIFGIVNAVLKPVVVIMSCPLIILTLGLFAIAINGIMLLITAAIAGNRFTIDGFWWAVLGGLVVGVIAGILENALGVNDKDNRDDEEVIIISR
jgi:putative membrane protein